MNDKRLGHLISSHLNGTLTSVEREELEERLQHSAADREHFWQQAEMHALLHHMLRSSLGAERQTPKSVRWLSWRPLASAAAVLLVLGLANWSGWMSIGKHRGDEHIREVALIAQESGAKWNGADWRTGDRLRPGTVKLDQGLVRLRFFSGATLLLRGPAELDLHSEMEARVRRGVVTATVPSVAQGFTLSTDGWRLVDRGTVFGVHAPSGAAAEMHVLTGQVDLHREGLTTALEKSMTTGQAARLERDGVLATFDATPDFFPSETDMLTQTQSEQQQQWERAIAAMKKDSRLALYFDFDGAERDLGIIKNLAPQAAGGSDGVFIGGEWTEGRWPWKRAVEFRRAGDLIRAMPRLTLSAATFAAWVRFDDKPHRRRTLMLSPHVRRGQFYWLADAGAPGSKGDHILFIKTPAKGSDLVNTAQNVVSQSDRQRWQHLAVVHDVATMQLRFFVNGRLVSEQGLSSAEPLDLEQIVVGNWGYTQEAGNFNGRMDELAIFSAALTAEEIFSHYQNGV